MAYEKLNLKDGTVLNEEHLAHIENGIEDAETVGADAVLYTAQTLTEKQQHQARENIRCGSVGNVADNCVAAGKYANAEGYETKATGNYSHTEGHTTTSSGSYCHAEGRDTTASGSYAHAENANTTAVGQASHAEGRYTRSEGNYSHTEGFNTCASRAYQHVEGAYNVVDEVGSSISDKGKYAHIVGNGTSNTDRSNAHTLDWDGVPWFAGDRVMLGGTGMDDEAAVALMPIFVPQKLTEEQKIQARANIGVDAYIEQVFLGGEW